MAEAPRDQNHVPTALFESSSTPGLTLPGQINQSTGRVLVDSSGGGTVTEVSVVTANGFAGTVADETTTPAITLSTTITGILQGNGTAISAITVGTGLDFTGGTLTATNTSTGTVTSVAMTVPTGLTISGSPITTTGTLAVALDTGYVIPLQSTIDGKANTALSNLASVAINTSLISDTDATDDLGSSAIKWNNIFGVNLGATATRFTKGWFTDLESTNMPTVGGTSLSSILLPLAGGTMTGNITLGENTSIALDPAGSADGKYSGITITAVAGYTQAFGDLNYLSSSDSRWELTDADAATTSDRFLAMVVVPGTDGTACTMLLIGQIRADAKFPALTIGSAVYVGETAGEIQVAIPTGADNVIRRVGYALTADEIYFNPSMDSQTTVA